MLTMLEVEKSKKILEVAVGPGYLVPYLLSRKNPKAELFLTDLAGEFLALTAKRVELFEQNKYEQIYNFNLKEVQPFEKSIKIERFNTVL